MLERVKATASVVYNGVLSRVFLQLNRSADDDLDDLDDFVKCVCPSWHYSAVLQAACDGRGRLSCLRPTYIRSVHADLRTFDGVIHG